jgi:FkbM family methyltransferase
MTSESAWGAYAPNGAVKLLLETTLKLPRSWTGKRLFYALRRLGRARLAGQPVDVVRFGAKLRLNACRNNVCEGRILFNPDYFDYRERAFLKESLPARPIFIDAGANIGGYSFFVCHVRPDAQVISIEAQDNTYRKLSFNAAQNPQMKIQAVNCALSSENGTAKLFINDTNNGETSIRLLNGGGQCVAVTAATLLKVAQDHDLPRIDAIKLDIEGAEDMVLKSFFETAPEHLYPKLILIENSPKRWDFNVITFLESLGYRKIRHFGGNVVLERAAEIKRSPRAVPERAMALAEAC